MRFLLDTNIISDLIKHPKGAAEAGIRQVGEDNVFTSIIVAAELRFGVLKRGSSRLASLVNGALERVGVVDFAAPSDRLYAELRVHLERRGTPIGAKDCLIAGHALGTESTLVTDNVREFSRVPGLVIENWLRL